MPPVLHVTLSELMRGGKQELRASYSTARDAERHHVLQLVAETIRAANLIETSAGPYPAGERLVEQPAIQQQVHAGIGGGDLHVAQRVVPTPLHVLQHRVQIFFAVAIQQTASAIGIFGLAQEENDFGLGPGLQFERSLQRAAGIEACADFAGKRATAPQRGGTIERTIAS